MNRSFAVRVVYAILAVGGVVGMALAVADQWIASLAVFAATYTVAPALVKRWRNVLRPAEREALYQAEAAEVLAEAAAFYEPQAMVVRYLAGFLIGGLLVLAFVANQFGFPLLVLLLWIASAFVTSTLGVLAWRAGLTPVAATRFDRRTIPLVRVWAGASVLPVGVMLALHYATRSTVERVALVGGAALYACGSFLQVRKASSDGRWG